MPHSITEVQNLPDNIKRLAAQRELYSEAKKCLGFVLILSVPVMMILTTIVLVLNNPTLAKIWGFAQQDLSWLLVVLSFLVVIVDVLIMLPIINKKKELAARVQELYDTQVLGLQWNHMAGDKPDPEIIQRYADKHLSKTGNRENLVNWYSDLLNTVPVDVGRLCCQRSNFAWDSELRKRYVKGLALIAIVIVIIVCVVSTTMNLSLREFFTIVIATIVPAIIFFIQQIHDNQQAIQSLDRLKSKTETLWQQLITTRTSTESESRQLQDVLFNMRKTNPLIFDCIYIRAKKGQETGMYYSVRQSIEEYNR